MGIQVKKWGNSAAIRIPSAIMAAAALNVGQEVEVSQEGGRIIIEPVLKPVYKLDELLAGMKPETFHEIVDFGPPVGNEVLGWPVALFPTPAILCGCNSIPRQDMSRRGIVRPSSSHLRRITRCGA